MTAMLGPSSAVRPAATCSRSPSAIPIEYELVESHPLPTLDCAKCIKDVVFAPRWLRACNHVLHRTKKLIAMSYGVGLVLGYLFWMVNAPMGRVFAVIGAVLQLFPLLAGLLVMRYDMVVVLLRTYDFLYPSVTNVIISLLACASFADARGCAVMTAFAGYEMVLLVDANYRGVKSTVVGSVVTTAVMLTYLVFAAFHLFDAARVVVLFRYGSWTLEASDVIVNGLSTILVLLLRNGYRKHTNMTRNARDSATVQCIAVSCAIRLERVEKLHKTPRVTRTLGPDESALRTPLELVRTGLRFAAQDTITTRRLSGGAHARLVRVATQMCGFAGLALTTASFRDSSDAIAVAALLVTLLHVAVCVVHFQRQLLRVLVGTFDFWFLSIQLTLAHASLCHLFQWDHRVWGMASSWLWAHWVISIDALSPDAKAKLGVSMRFTGLVLAGFVAAQVLICCEIVFLGNWQIHDRVVLTVTIARHTTRLRVAPFFFSRVFTIFCWSWRLLWRVARAAPDELLMVVGAVQYEDLELRRRLQRALHRQAAAKHASGGAVAPVDSPHKAGGS